MAIIQNGVSIDGGELVPTTWHMKLDSNKLAAGETEIDLITNLGNHLHCNVVNCGTGIKVSSGGASILKTEITGTWSYPAGTASGQCGQIGVHGIKPETWCRYFTDLQNRGGSNVNRESSSTQAGTGLDYTGASPDHLASGLTGIKAAWFHWISNREQFAGTARPADTRWNGTVEYNVALDCLIYYSGIWRITEAESPESVPTAYIRSIPRDNYATDVFFTVWEATKNRYNGNYGYNY